MRISLSWLLCAILLITSYGPRPVTAQAENKQVDPKRPGPPKRLLVITQSITFVHEPVRRKVTLAPDLDPAALPKIPGLELKVAKSPKGGKDKITAIYSGRIQSEAPLEFFADKDGQKSFVAKVEPCLAELTFIELGKKNGFEVVGSQDARAEITAENLKNFDALWFYTTGPLPLSDTQKESLLAFVKNGKGFGGSHSATDTFHDWKEYGNLIGAYFDTHPWTQVVNVVVEDKEHISTKHLGNEFTIKDEIYEFKGPYDRTKLHILMHLDRSQKMKQGKRADNDNAIAWTNQYGQGRVFYTALGHFPEVWQDPRYQQHILGGLQYLFGK